MLTFGGASAVKADDQEESELLNRARVRNELFKELGDGLEGLENKKFPTPGGNLDNTYMTKLLEYLQEREQAENNWRTRLLKGMQDHVLDGKDGKPGETGPAGPAGAPGPAGPA
ncbi:hypothetical protein DJ560_08855, partial [Streptococcus pyogenes]